MGEGGGTKVIMIKKRPKAYEIICAHAIPSPLVFSKVFLPSEPYDIIKICLVVSVNYSFCLQE